MPNRIEGQIWIDKNSPYSLKYYTNTRDYTVQVANSYKPKSEQGVPFEVLYSGTVVKFSGEDVVSPAEFPDDIDNVLGVVVGTVSVATQPVTVTQTGYLVLDEEALDHIFYGDDLLTSYNGFTASSGIGAPVYWFIGRQNADYTYVDSKDHKGKLTLATPSGMKWGVTAVTDNSLNVGYDNLPQIGTIAKYTVENGKITSMDVHLNLSTFDSSLEWSWPYIKTNEAATKGYIAGVTTREGTNLIIRHGLFADYRQSALQIGDVEIFAGDTENATLYSINTSHEDIVTGADRQTKINLNTPEDLYYKVSGTVRYRFDETHQ